MESVSEKLPPTFDKRCGTTAGYKAHYKRKENFCSGCREAKLVSSREYRKKNTDALKESSKAYRLANREKGIESSRAWRLANPERAVSVQKAWHAANKEKRDATNKVWRLANPEKVREYARLAQKRLRAAYPEISAEKSSIGCRTRRARKLAAPSEPYTTQDILDLWGTNCHICKEPIDLDSPRSTNQIGWEHGLHLDHVVPLSLGGSNLMVNVKPSHGLCNLKKHTNQSAN